MPRVTGILSIRPRLSRASRARVRAKRRVHTSGHVTRLPGAKQAKHVYGRARRASLHILSTPAEEVLAPREETLEADSRDVEESDSADYLSHPLTRIFSPPLAYQGCYLRKRKDISKPGQKRRRPKGRERSRM